MGAATEALAIRVGWNMYSPVGMAGSANRLITRANESRRADFARQVRDEHDKILRAIEAGDAAAARKAAARHMDNAILRIEQAAPAFWQQAGGEVGAPTGLGPASAELPPLVSVKHVILCGAG